jgi:hypothetical protein
VMARRLPLDPTAGQGQSNSRKSVRRSPPEKRRAITSGRKVMALLAWPL